MKKMIAIAVVAAVTLGNLQFATAATKTYIKNATGLGVSTSIASSKDAAADKAGTAQVDSLIAAVTFDKDGKITKCTIDGAQTKIPFDAKGQVTVDKAAEQKTKNEKGETYGMKKSSKIGKEWNEQAAAFAAWTIGKTVEQVAGMKVTKHEGSDSLYADVPELATSCTVSVGDFVEAIDKAAQMQAQGALAATNKTGVGVVTSIASSKSATAEAAGNGQVDSTIAAVTIDDKGKIVSCLIDAAQTKVAISAKGEVTSDKAAAIQTKLEKGEAYGMKKGSKISKEWNEQATAFSKWAVGKTVAEVKALKVKKVDDSHTAVPDVAELTSSVTVSVGDFIVAVEKAVKNAK